MMITVFYITYLFYLNYIILQYVLDDKKMK